MSFTLYLWFIAGHVVYADAMCRFSQPRTFFTPDPRYSTEGLNPSEAAGYNKGWTEAMEAVQYGAVCIDGMVCEFPWSSRKRFTDQQTREFPCTSLKVTVQRNPKVLLATATASVGQ